MCQAYHLVNERSLPLSEAIQHLNEIMSVELRETSYEEWRQALCAAPDTNVLLPLAAAFKDARTGGGFPQLDRQVECDNTIAALASLRAGGSEYGLSPLFALIA
jgi:hypothetical protein